MWNTRGEGGTSSIVGLVISVGVITVTFAAVMEYPSQNNYAGSERANDAQLAVLGDALADRIFGQPGRGWYSTTDCDLLLSSGSAPFIPVVEQVNLFGNNVPIGGSEAGSPYFHPDDIEAFGLLRDVCDEGLSALTQNGLGFAKARALFGSNPSDSENNGKVDYPNATRLLGLNATGLNFHLNGVPVTQEYPGFDAGYRTMKARPLYIGDYEPLPETPLILNFCTPKVFLTEVLTTAACTDILGTTITTTIDLSDDCSGVEEVDCSILVDEDEAHYEPQETAIREVDYLEELFPATFSEAVVHSDYHHDDIPYDPAGSVFPDEAGTLINLLPDALETPSGDPTLSKFNVVVVGSNVDNLVMSNSLVRSTLFEWVKRGGYLIVLGSIEELTWTITEFEVTLVANLNPPILNEVDHYLIKAPNELTWSSYETNDKAWKFVGDVDSYLRVLKTSDVVTYSHLATSQEGRIGAGRALFTAWQPNNEEILENFFTVSFGELFMKYGPEVPSTVSVDTNVRIMTIYHPYVGDTVDVRYTLEVWGTYRATPIPTTPTTTTGPLGELTTSSTGATTTVYITTTSCTTPPLLEPVCVPIAVAVS